MIATMGATANAAGGKRPLGVAMRRGFFGRCPHCSKGHMFRAYLKVVEACPACGEDLSHQRADDAPPYVTMVIVGHIVVAGVLAAEQAWPNSPMWLGAIVWTWLTFALSLLLLPRVKGALVGVQWALRMHGFGGADGEAA